MLRNCCMGLGRGLVIVVLGYVAGRAEPAEFSKFDKNHSTIGFRVPILGGLSSVEGKFTAFDVQLRYDSVDASKCFVGATIETASIHTGIEERDEHLRSADFLDAATHSKIMFVSKKVERSPEGFLVHGTLSMRGTSLPVELLCRVTGLTRDSASGDALIGLHATTTLNRQDYGVSWKHPDPLFVGDSVEVEISLISKLTPQR